MKIQSVALSYFLVACAPASSEVRSSSFDLEMHAVGMAATPASDPRLAHLLVTTEPTCPRGHNCDIVEVLDLHTSATSQDKGFDELRARAIARQGDAVIGAEFEHGEGSEPSHLSGVIVRYGQPVPPHVDLGEVDIPSDPQDRDKGLAVMMGRAHAMGGDQVIDVTFEHGDDGAQGHLRGKVVRFTRE